MNQIVCILSLAIAVLQAPAEQTAPVAPQSVPASRQASRIALLEIKGPIDRLTLQSLLRRAEEAKSDGADVLVLELDTPGGDLEATLEICLFLKEKAELPTGAWVNPEAYSAGAIMALATDNIVMAPGSRMGDAAPIQLSPVGLVELSTTERAKIEAPVLAEVVDSARRNGYDEKLVQSMVSVRFALWELLREETGERLFVDANEYQRVFGEAPPVQRGRGSEPAAASTAPPLDETTMQEVDAIQGAYSDRPSLGPEDADDWILVGQVVGDEELLVVNAEEAVRTGLSKAIVADSSALERWYGARALVRYPESWSDGLIRLLTSWPIKLILIGIVVIGFMIEISAPGTSVFGGAALLALAVLVGAPMLGGFPQWWAVLLIITGISLVGAEVVLLPGVGVAGITGTVSLLSGLIALMVTADMGTSEANNQIALAVTAIFAAMLLGGTAAWWIARQSGGFWLFRRLVLDAQSGTSAGPPPSPSPASPADSNVGTAVTDLRPSGKIRVADRVMVARSTTGWVDAGTRVRLLREFAGEWEVAPMKTSGQEGEA